MLAQQTINYATASGRVTGPTSAVVSGAQVTARETETNQTNTATTDAEGTIPLSLPGNPDLVK